LELRVLKYFLTVAREENITHAAALLHMTQPSLSRQMMQLEEELGVKLFQRSRYRIVLTEDGMLLRRRAQEIVDLAEKTAREFARQEQISGEILIGSGDLKNTHVLAKLIASFRAQYPLVRFEIYSGNSDNIKERIEQGILDLGLLLEPVDISKYEFVQMPEKEEWGAMVSEDSPLASKEAVTPKDLIGMPLILTRRELVRNEFTRWLGSYGEQTEITASGNLPYNMVALVRENIGTFINLKLDCQYDGVQFIPLSPKLESRTVLVWKKAETFSPAVAAFIKYAQKCLNSISGD